jgi:hypothetical protein
MGYVLSNNKEKGEKAGEAREGEKRHKNMKCHV